MKGKINGKLKENELISLTSNKKCSYFFGQRKRDTTFIELLAAAKNRHFGIVNTKEGSCLRKNSECKWH